MKTALLPAPAEIMRRLTAADDTHWNIQHFYPTIAKAGGGERNGPRLVLLFELAIADACEGPPLDTVMRLNVPMWLRAIVDDQEVLAEALAAFDDINGPRP